MSDIEHSQDYEDGALDALDYITDGREDLEDLTMRVAEKIGANIVARRKRERGAVSALDLARGTLKRVAEGCEEPAFGAAMCLKAIDHLHPGGQ
jgi:hypothetical protein